MEVDSKKNLVAGIIIAHGELAAELLRTAEVIIGKVENFFALSGSNLTDEDIVAEIREIISRYSEGKTLIFVDYFGSSCCTNSMKAVHGLENVKVISGVNLPVILDFVTKRKLYDFDEMVEHILKRGRESVRLVEF